MLLYYVAQGRVECSSGRAGRCWPGTETAGSFRAAILKFKECAEAIPSNTLRIGVDHRCHRATNKLPNRPLIRPQRALRSPPLGR